MSDGAHSTREPGRLIAREGWIVFAVAFAIRLGSCAAKYGLGRVHARDYLEYVHVGERFLQFGTLVSPLTFDAGSSAPSAILPPGYSVFVAAVFWLLGVRSSASILVLQLINAVASALAVVLVYSIARRLVGTANPLSEGESGRTATTAARITALVVAINPCLFGYTWMIWDTSLFIFGVCFVLWFALARPSPSTATHESSRSWTALGLLFGALAMLNPSFTPVYPLLVLWPLVRRNGWMPRRFIRPVAMCVLGWGAVITPWTIRNYVQTDRLFYIRCGLPMEFWLGVCPEADVGGADAFRSEFPLSNVDAEDRIRAMGDLAFIDECGQRAWLAIRSDPLRYAKLVAVRTVDYWTGTVFEHSVDGSGWPANRVRAVTTIFLMIEGATLLGLIVVAGSRCRIPKDVLWLLAAAATFSVLYCLTHIQLRYRAPAEPLLALALGLLAAHVLPRPIGAGLVGDVSNPRPARSEPRP